LGPPRPFNILAISPPTATAPRHASHQALLDKPQALFALVLSPTRELAIQIAEQFEALGAGIGVKCAVLVGGIDMMAQARDPGWRGGGGGAAAAVVVVVVLLMLSGEKWC